MRRLLLLGSAIVALLGFTAVTAAPEPNINHAFFFGDCEPSIIQQPTGSAAATGYGFGCRGFGIFFGDFEDEEDVAYAIQQEAYEQGIGPVAVLKLYAYKFGLGANFVPAITGTDGDYEGCRIATDQVAAESASQISDIGGGLWIAWFTVEVCGYYGGAG